MDAITQVIKGQDIQDRDAAYLLEKSLLKEDALQVFNNEEASQENKDGLAFTKCLAAVTEHIFSKKAYKTQKKYIRNIHKPLAFGSREWISRMIKLNDHLKKFPVPDGVTAKKISREEFVDLLEDGVPYQWKMEFEKEGFDSSSSTLKEFLEVCVRLEEAELQKPLKKRIACAAKEHEESDDDKPIKPRYKRRKGQTKRYGRRILRQQSKRHGGKRMKKFCDYHGVCYHDTSECNLAKSCKKHVQPIHHITEQQRLWQVRFVKDTKRQAKKRSLTGREVKDLNAFVKDKINETIKERNCNMYAMSNFNNLSLSSSNESMESIISNTSDEESGECRKPAHKK